MSNTSLKKHCYFKKKQEIPAFLIVLGLILIFVIGYIFWSSKEKEKIDHSDKEQNKEDEILKTLEQYKLDYEKAKINLALKRVKRRNYFLCARLLLVLIALSYFLILQYWFDFAPYKKPHVVDNLRNYLSLIVIVFTTIAFITKGNLKDFKESIEEMATNWFFKEEEALQLEIQYKEMIIISLTNHIEK